MENNAILNHHGKDKEIKWVEVDHHERVVSIFFTDFTYVRLENVKIKEVE